MIVKYTLKELCESKRYTGAGTFDYQLELSILYRWW